MITTGDLKTAAGILLGEGWFSLVGDKRNTMAVAANQVEREPMAWLHQLFGGSLTFQESKVISRKTGKLLAGQNHWQLSGVQAAGLAMTLYPLLFMSPKRQAEIRRALAVWRAAPIAPQYRTHCPQGHEYTPDNIYNKGLYGNGHKKQRLCRACTKQKNDARSPELKRLYRRRAMAKKPEYYRQAQRDYRERRLASALLEAI